MCGRVVAERSAAELAEIYGAEEVDAAASFLGPRWNVAPLSPLLVVVASDALHATAGRPSSPHGHGGRAVVVARWGLVPPFADDPSFASRAINARAETLAQRPAFRGALARRRCVVPVDAFYEWASPPAPAGRPRRRLPHCCRRRDGAPLALAGLWEEWSKGGEALRTCTIVTTSANAIVGALHDRMPAVLDPAGVARWLEPEPPAPAELSVLLRPAPDDVLECYPVDPRVNDARYDDPSCCEPLPAPTP